jgi:hypothetical protein
MTFKNAINAIGLLGVGGLIGTYLRIHREQKKEAQLRGYVSDELTHFVGRGKNEQEQYKLLKLILTTRQLKSPGQPQNGAWSISILNQRRFSKGEVFIAKVVCFCDIPREHLEIHMGKFSRFGLAFPKRFMISHAANPVYYVGMDYSLGANDLAPVGKPGFDQNPHYWNEVVGNYLQIMSCLHDLTKVRSDMPKGDQISRMLNMIDFRILSFIKPVDSNILDVDCHKANVYMEREWRIFGKLDFTFDDVSRIILPKAFDGPFRTDFPALASKIYTV